MYNVERCERLTLRDEKSGVVKVCEHAVVRNRSCYFLVPFLTNDEGSERTIHRVSGHLRAAEWHRLPSNKLSH